VFYLRLRLPHLARKDATATIAQILPTPNLKIIVLNKTIFCAGSSPKKDCHWCHSVQWARIYLLELVWCYGIQEDVKTRWSKGSNSCTSRTVNSATCGNNITLPMESLYTNWELKWTMTPRSWRHLYCTHSWAHYNELGYQSFIFPYVWRNSFAVPFC
jgi:hypothetical protein